MTKEQREKRVRLSMDVPTVLHTKLKELAILHNCTITTYVLRAVIERLKVEEQFK